jgi:c-di-GMP-binding flagellar brake protein YcgR
VPQLRKDNAESRLVPFDEMNLQVGARLQVLLVRDVKPIQYFCALVGFVKGEYLIVRQPPNIQASPFREGDKLTVRVFSGVKVCSFNVTVLRLFDQPSHYFHASFPDRVIGTSLRSAMRIKVDIPATITKPADAAFKPASVLLDNVSVSGALMASAMEVGKQDEQIELQFALFSRPLDLEMAITAKAVIRNVSVIEENVEEKKYLTGAEFIGLDATSQIVLQNLAYKTVIDDRQKIV